MFFHDGDYRAFLKALGDLKQRWPFELYGYCLMSNHFHLLVQPRECSISRRRWSAYVHQTPEDRELATIRRSLQRGLPLGEARWVQELSEGLDIDLTIRPRGRPRKAPEK